MNEPTSAEIERPNCTRLRVCGICPFIGSDINKTETDQDQYHRDAMLGMAKEGDGVWTCLHHLHYEKTMRAQCHVGAKELARARTILGNRKELNNKSARAQE